MPFSFAPWLFCLFDFTWFCETVCSTSENPGTSELSSTSGSDAAGSKTSLVSAASSISDSSGNSAPAASESSESTERDISCSFSSRFSIASTSSSFFILDVFFKPRLFARPRRTDTPSVIYFSFVIINKSPSTPLRIYLVRKIAWNHAEDHIL